MNENERDPNARHLNIVEPCPKRWNELEGAGTKRFCDQCSLHVVDGSAMTLGEAESLVAGTKERVCMRLVKDENGRFVHADTAPKPRVLDRILRYGLTAAAGVLVACGDDRKEPADPDTKSGTGSPTDPAPGDAGERPPEIMGEVCFPEEPGDELENHEEFMGIVAPDFDGGNQAPGTDENDEIMGKVAPGSHSGDEGSPDE